MARGMIERLVRGLEAPIEARGFGAYCMPGKEWPSGYGVPEAVPKSYRAQLAYPFRRLWRRGAKS